MEQNKIGLPFGDPVSSSSCPIIQSTPVDCKDLLKEASTLYIDAEWGWKIHIETPTKAGKITAPISFQIAALDKEKNPLFGIFFLTDDYPLPTLNYLTLPNGHPFSGHPIYVAHVPKHRMIEGMFSLFESLASRYNVELFHSPKDLEFAIGKASMQLCLTSKNNLGQPLIQKRRNLSGRVPHQKSNYKLTDRAGMFNCSLEDAIAGVGQEATGKQFVNLWNKKWGVSNIKATMGLPAKECPNEFFSYAMGDVLDLPVAVSKRVELYNVVCKEAWGLDPDFTIDNCPNSSGKLVWTLFNKFLKHFYPGLYNKIISYTDTLSDKHRDDVRVLERQTIETYDEVFKKLNHDNSLIHGLAMGSIQNFAILAGNNHTGSYGAVVHGGRCANEEWYEKTTQQRIYNVVDPDLSSCYGTALEKFFYPVGIPTIVGSPAKSPLKTLGEILDKYEKDLVPGLWVAYLEGMISFDQDLLVSKYNLSNHDVVRKLLHTWDDDFEGVDEIDIPHLVGDFEITTREIKLGVLTSESLNLLRKVASNKEWEEIKNLKVATLIYYPASKELSHEEWIAHNVGGYVTDFEKKETQRNDQRSRYWTRISLGEFISPLKTKRGEFKKLAKAAKAEGDLEKARYYDGLQTSLKLIVNTTYGCLASPYFPMGNTVVANNITDKARVGAWMMSKALQSVQSITDGGAFCADKVSYLRPEKKENKKPGLHVMADRQRLRRHRCVETRPLFPELGCSVKEWLVNGSDKPNKERVDELNKRVMEHINNFWYHYGLKLPFDIEVKEDHTADYMVYRAKADYLLVNPIKPKHEITLPNGEKKNYLYKVRGARSIENRSVNQLLSLAFPGEVEFDNCATIEEKTVGVKEYQKANNPADPFTPGDVRFVPNIYIPNPYRGKKAATSKELERQEKGAEKHKKRFKDAHYTEEIQAAQIQEYIEHNKTLTKVAPPELYKAKPTEEN